MADARMPDEFYELARPLLPPEKEVGPQGGLVGGGEGLLHHLPGRRPYLADVVHRPRTSNGNDLI